MTAKGVRHPIRNLITMGVLFVLIFPCLRMRLQDADLSSTSVLNISFDVVGLFTVIALFNATVGDEFQEARGTRAFPYLLLSEYLALYTDIFAWLIDRQPGLRWANILDNTLFYFSSVALSSSYLVFVQDILQVKGRRMRTFLSLSRCFSFLSTVLIVLNIPFGFYFHVDEANCYAKTVLYPLTFLYPLFIMFSTIFLLMKEKKKKDISLNQQLALIFYVSGPILSAVIQTFTYGISFIYISALIGMLFVFASFYMTRGRNLIKERMKVQEKEILLEEQRQRIMLCQIQPHFMFNALSSIAHLTKKDSEKAYQMTNDFAEYLRHNLESLSGEPVIPFRKELDHIEKYVNIEKARFGDKVNVVYDLGPQDFLVPVLSIQPLVENAIKHGILKNRNGGTVLLRTEEISGDRYLITVKDNGVGFNPNELPADGKTHIGLSNIRSRLESLSSAIMGIISVPGTGTTVLIYLPKRSDPS